MKNQACKPEFDKQRFAVAVYDLRIALGDSRYKLSGRLQVSTQTVACSERWGTEPHLAVLARLWRLACETDTEKGTDIAFVFRELLASKLGDADRESERELGNHTCPLCGVWLELLGYRHPLLASAPRVKP